jgi:hypothetical protein
MKRGGPAAGLKRLHGKRLMRSSVLLVALLFLFITAKAQPVSSNFSYDFNNGLGKAWRIASWQSPDSKPGLNYGIYIPENVDFVDGMVRLKVEQTQGSDGVISKGAAIWTVAPAYIILQIRGTNSDQWGGKATLNAIRYAYVKSVKFHPA